MITEEKGLMMLAGANPVPQLDQVDVDVEAATYLAILEQRSSEMTRLDTKSTEIEKPKRRRLALVLGTAAVAILIGAVLMFSQNEETPPPATQLTPTTVAAVVPPTAAVDEPATTLPEVIDPQVEQGLAVATAFIEALLVGDLATAESLALSSVPTFLVDGGGSPGVGPSGEIPWKDALGWEATLDECIVSSPDPVDTRITCSVTNSTDISRALGVSPYTSLHHYTVMHEGGTYFGQTIDDTKVVSSGGDADTWEKVGYQEFKARVFDPFMNWLEANHPDDLQQTMWHAFSLGVFSPDRWLTGDFGPHHSPESVELWGQYSQEYIAQLDN